MTKRGPKTFVQRGLEKRIGIGSTVPPEVYQVLVNMAGEQNKTLSEIVSALLIKALEIIHEDIL